MGQKIHPNGFRLGITRSHRSRWFATTDRYPALVQEDRQIREYLRKNLSNAGLSDIIIERKADQVDLEIHTSRPGVVVGRGGSGIEALRVGLLKQLENSLPPKVQPVLFVSTLSKSPASMLKLL